MFPTLFSPSFDNLFADACLSSIYAPFGAMLLSASHTAADLEKPRYKPDVQVGRFVFPYVTRHLRLKAREWLLQRKVGMVRVCKDAAKTDCKRVDVIRMDVSYCKVKGDGKQFSVDSGLGNFQLHCGEESGWDVKARKWTTLEVSVALNGQQVPFKFAADANAKEAAITLLKAHGLEDPFETHPEVVKQVRSSLCGAC